MKSRDRREGITLVHTGSGKGKSSSAFGVVFRAADQAPNGVAWVHVHETWLPSDARAVSNEAS